MKNNVIALPAGRIRRGTLIHQRKQAVDPDLYVDIVESDPGHIARRQARRDAYYAAIAREREDMERTSLTVGFLAMFSMLAALLGWGLWLC